MLLITNSKAPKKEVHAPVFTVLFVSGCTLKSQLSPEAVLTPSGNATSSSVFETASSPERFRNGVFGLGRKSRRVSCFKVILVLDFLLVWRKFYITFLSQMVTYSFSEQFGITTEI